MTQAATQTETALDLSGVDFTWPGGGFRLQVPAFSVAPGEAVLLLGASGSGKSTLLSLICGIVTPQAGSVTVMGQDTGRISAAARDRMRAERIGVIFQMFNLLPYASGLDNILLPLRFAPARRARCGDPRAEALALAGDLGLPEALMTEAAASTLSVGQQQRVAVARAMIGQPPLIIADEPSSALDADAQAGFVDILFRQLRAAGSGLLMVSHDERLAGQFDRVIAMKDIARTERRGAA